MPKRSSANVSLNKTLAFGVVLAPSDLDPDAEPDKRSPGLSKGLGYLILIVAPMAPLERAESGVFSTSS